MRFFRSKKESRIDFEEAFTDTLGDLEPDLKEVPLSRAPFALLSVAVVLLIGIVCARTLSFGIGNGDFWEARAKSNIRQLSRTSSPRGSIVDRNGVAIAQNKPVFSAVLDLRVFLRETDKKDATLKAIRTILGVNPEDVLMDIRERNSKQFTDALILSEDLTQEQIVALKTVDLPTISVVSSYERSYPDGKIFSSVVGYTSLANADDITKNPLLTSRDTIGKMGLEAYYDSHLRGTPGVYEKVHDARGRVIGEQEKTPGVAGETLALTIDAGLQKYFHDRLADQLARLGRTSGAGVAMNPKTGEILALVNFPTYDNNVFVQSGNNDEKRRLLTSATRPLFNRIVGGLYNPGSTIKPLVGVASLAESILPPLRTVFSPGYLEIPNPYNPNKPTRYVDWRYQGDVDLYRAIAYSSNVYFYTVGGGAGPIKGLGITHLQEWWKKFGLGSITGIDMPGEAKGFLPSPAWKEKQSGKPWLLGDTYNVSIGQGDLLVTPLQIASFISTIANGGKVMKPYIASAYSTSTIAADLKDLAPYIKEVQKGMRETVTNSRGTAYMMHDLPFAVSGKTGSAQVKNNTQENAFFVGYGPSEDPQVVVLVLIENAKEGSLNAVPVARDVFDWWGVYRLKTKKK